jgi:hypothetical protein
MKLRKWLANWDLKKLKINLKFLEMEWEPQESDREAAWELYVEMLTRIVTQPLPDEQGNEESALESVHQLFPLTREILKRKGRDCVGFTKIAVIVLNQLVRPFTTKWHTRLAEQGLGGSDNGPEFRRELAGLQEDLRQYAKTLAELAQVEDLSQLEADAT